MGILTREEVGKLLTMIRKKRPHLFEGLENESAKILASWSEALKDYQVEELAELFASGYYLPYYEYEQKDLTDIVKALEQQRWEYSSAGVAYREQLIKEWNERKKHETN